MTDKKDLLGLFKTVAERVDRRSFADVTRESVITDLGVDSLAYLDVDRLVSATGSPAKSFCTACFTGEYPVPVPDHDTKHALEAAATVPVPGAVELA